MLDLRVWTKKALLGKTNFEINKSKILLEYYAEKIHVLNRLKLENFYGITVVKKEYENDKVVCEKTSVNKISTSEIIIKNIIEMLTKHKVTPVALQDVLTDLLKKPEFQENSATGHLTKSC